MSEEEILLAAIQVNRADDAPRLAYADWLQEHGNESKAEFLRFECQHRLARIRMEQLRSLLEPKWLNAVMCEISLWLLGYPSNQKLTTIRTIRLLTGMGLYEAKGLSETLPNVVIKSIAFERAEEYLQQFQAIGATVELRYDPPE